MEEYPISEWRVIRDFPRPGAEGLALDEALLRSVSAGEAPNTMKIYYFSPPSAVLGLHQSVTEVDLAYLNHDAVDLNRRLTGGGAILLGLPDAYSQMGISVVARNTANLPANLRGKYEFFTPVIAKALNDVGLQSKVGQNFNIVAGSKKIAGCGIYADEGAFLFHVMILLDCDFGATARVLKLPYHRSFDSILKNMRDQVTTIFHELGKRIARAEVESALINNLSAIVNEPVVVGRYLDREILRCSSLLKTKYSSPDWVNNFADNASGLGACFVPGSSPKGGFGL